MLWCVIMLLTVSFFMSFRVIVVQIAKFDLTISSDQIMFVSMLEIWNLRYSRYFFIIKYIGIELIFFAINLNVVLSFKVYNTFNFMFLSIILLT